MKRFPLPSSPMVFLLWHMKESNWQPLRHESTRLTTAPRHIIFLAIIDTAHLLARQDFYVPMLFFEASVANGSESHVFFYFPVNNKTF